MVISGFGLGPGTVFLVLGPISLAPLPNPDFWIFLPATGAGAVQGQPGAGGDPNMRRTWAARMSGPWTARGAQRVLQDGWERAGTNHGPGPDRLDPWEFGTHGNIPPGNPSNGSGRQKYSRNQILMIGWLVPSD